MFSPSMVTHVLCSVVACILIDCAVTSTIWSFYLYNARLTTIAAYHAIWCSPNMGKSGFITNPDNSIWKLRLFLLSFAFTISNFVSAASWRPHRVPGVILKCCRRSKSTGTRSQYASLFSVHRSRIVARRCNPTHACCCGPASDRNLFSRLHWPWGRSIPGSWMVGSLINDLFGTSTIWFCHRVLQSCWMGCLHLFRILCPCNISMFVAQLCGGHGEWRCLWIAHSLHEGLWWLVRVPATDSFHLRWRYSSRPKAKPQFVRALCLSGLLHTLAPLLCNYYLDLVTFIEEFTERQFWMWLFEQMCEYWWKVIG